MLKVKNEIVTIKDLDHKVFKKSSRQVFAFLNIFKMYNVEIRKNGLTGSGKLNECHANVTKLVLLYGGKRANGIAITMTNNFISFAYHSVWQTPENELVDVTWAKDTDKDKLLSVDSFYFAPTDYIPSLDIVVKRTSNEILVLDRSNFRNAFDLIPIRKKVLRNKRFTNTFFTPFKPMKDVTRLLQFDDMRTLDSFTEPSSATGKHFRDIWADYLKKQSVEPIYN